MGWEGESYCRRGHSRLLDGATKFSPPLFGGVTTLVAPYFYAAWGGGGGGGLAHETLHMKLAHLKHF